MNKTFGFTLFLGVALLSCAPKANQSTNTLEPAASNVLVLSTGLHQISAGFQFTCGLTPTGKAYCWGRNEEGQLGNNSTTNSSVPVMVAAPKAEGALNFSSISTGAFFACGLTLDRRAYCWGFNKFGQLGNKTTTDSSVPVAVASKDGSVQNFSSLEVGGGQACGLTVNGTAYCWGLNDHGQLGNGSTENSNVPVTVATTVGGTTLIFSRIVAGMNHSCGLTTIGKAYCWGWNAYGQLGNTVKNSSIPIAVIGPLLNFSGLWTKEDATCGLNEMGTAYCWGDNLYGQLGFDNGERHSNLPMAVTTPEGEHPLTFSSLASSSRHTCGLSNGKTYCWGRNDEGELGNGTWEDSLAPIAVIAPATGFSSISGGLSHTCGVTSNDTVYCWGRNEQGQLGNGNTISANIPVPVAVIPK